MMHKGVRSVISILIKKFYVALGLVCVLGISLSYASSHNNKKAATTKEVAFLVDAAIAKTALDAIGASVGCDGALVGGVTTAGAASTSDVHVTFAYGTAAMTAGAGVLTLRYIEPQGTQGASFAAVE